MRDSQHVLPKKQLAELLEVTIPGLRAWYRKGAPLREDLSGDAIEVAEWYLFENPLFSLQWLALRRRSIYPDLIRRLRRERRRAAKVAEAQK